MNPGQARDPFGLPLSSQVNYKDTDAIVIQLSTCLRHIESFAETGKNGRYCYLANPHLIDHHHSIGFALSYSNFDGPTLLKDLDPQEESQVVPRPWYPYRNSGPEDVWRFIHKQASIGELIFSKRHRFRRWAYVMWDRSRLEGWGVFERAWDYVQEKWVPHDHGCEEEV